MKIFVLIFVGLMVSMGVFAQRKIKFSGIDWYVKDGFYGPGPNYWSDSKRNVWLDSRGFLHLKIRKSGGKWCCSEIYSVREFGYGEFRFKVASNVGNYTGNIMVGLFIYENDSSEIDIEFPNRGNGKIPGWYTVQSSNREEKSQDIFQLNLKGDYSTHQINWYRDSVAFESYHGHGDSSAGSGHLMNKWTYKGENIPEEGNERLHINFWLSEGKAPANEEEAELVIKEVLVKLH